MQMSPNISITPGRTEAAFDDLVASTNRGVAILGGGISTDQQCLNGEGVPMVAYEIRQGKLTSRLTDIAYLYRAPEHWRSLVALGGPSSYTLYAATMSKGQPSVDQQVCVGAVPTKFREVRVINIGRAAP